MSNEGTLGLWTLIFFSNGKNKKMEVKYFENRTKFETKEIQIEVVESTSLLSALLAGS